MQTSWIHDNPSLFQPVPASSLTHFPNCPWSTRPSLDLTIYFTFPRRGSNPQPLYHEPFSIPLHQRFSRQSTSQCSINTDDCNWWWSDGAIAALHTVVMQQCHCFKSFIEWWRYLFIINYRINYGIVINYCLYWSGSRSLATYATHLGRSVHWELPRLSLPLPRAW